MQLSETLLSKDVCQIKTVAIWKTNNIVVYFWVVPHRNEHQKEDSLFSLKLSCMKGWRSLQKLHSIGGGSKEMWTKFGKCSVETTPQGLLVHMLFLSHIGSNKHIFNQLFKVYSQYAAVFWLVLGRVKTISVKEWQGSINRWLEAASLLQNTSISIALTMIYQETKSDLRFDVVVNIKV